MNKTLRTALIVGVILVMAAGLVYQETKVSTHQEIVDSYEEEIDKSKDKEEKLKRRIDILQKRIEDLELEKGQLARQNRILGDSLLAKNKQIKTLNKRLQIQTELLTKREEELNRLRGDSKDLVNRVASLRQEKGADESLIRQLDDQRAALDKRIGELFMEKDSLERKTLESNKDLAKLNKDFSEQEQILQIVENVKVDFGEVLPRKANNKKARKLRQWDYTLINLKLDAPSIEALRGQQFIVKIIDKDNGVILPPREASGNQDTEGEVFVFNGNPVPPIRYSHYQEKKGENYMIQVFFIQDGKEYPLSFGASTIDI